MEDNPSPASKERAKTANRHLEAKVTSLAGMVPVHTEREPQKVWCILKFFVGPVSPKFPCFWKLSTSVTPSVRSLLRCNGGLKGLLPMASSPLSEQSALWETIVPEGARWSKIIYRGQVLRIELKGASSGVPFLCYNAKDTSERYNAADTVKVQWTATLGKGKLLFSDMGRVLFTIVGDNCGEHDALLGCSSSWTNRRKYGREDLNNARDNFRILAGRHGMSRRDLMPNLNFFAKVEVDPDGTLHYVPGVGQAGCFVELRAEMDVIAMIANCPHPSDPQPAYQQGEVQLKCYPGRVPEKDDYYRNLTPESLRGFENTERYLS